MDFSSVARLHSTVTKALILFLKTLNEWPILVYMYTYKYKTDKIKEKHQADLQFPIFWQLPSSGGYFLQLNVGKLLKTQFIVHINYFNIWERESGTQRQRETETECERDRDTHTHTHTNRETERETERERERESLSVTLSKKDRRKQGRG